MVVLSMFVCRPEVILAWKMTQPAVRVKNFRHIFAWQFSAAVQARVTFGAACKNFEHRLPAA
jgi:hypothetical protein